MGSRRVAEKKHVGATLPSTSLRDGEHSRTVRTVSLCFGKAQHNELVELSNRMVARGVKKREGINPSPTKKFLG